MNSRKNYHKLSPDYLSIPANETKHNMEVINDHLPSEVIGTKKI